MHYVLDGIILTEIRLYKALSNKLGVTVCRHQPPRREDLDNWAASELQPDQPPIADIVTATNSVEQRADGRWYRVYETRDYTAAERRQNIRERRDLAIYAGITVNGLVIDTDEITQGRLAGAALQAFIDPNYTVNWKAGGQFYTLDANQIIAVAQAVRAHVQACFDREAELLSLTDPETGEPRDPTADDIEAGWPA